MGMEAGGKKGKEESDCVAVCCGPLIWSRSCVCCCCPPSRESNTARTAYTVIFAVILALSCLSHEMEIINKVQEELGETFYNRTCLRFFAGPNCERVTGYQGVYRLCALLFFFHCMMALMTVCVNSSDTVCAAVHNGFWMWKLLLLAFVWCMLYLVPLTEYIVLVWKLLGIVCCFLFVLLQQMSLIDAAYALNNYLRARSVRNCCYGLILYFLTCFILAGDIIAYVFLWRYYASVDEDFRICLHNFIFLVINGTLAFVLCVSSFFVVRKGMHMWLQGPFMVTYTLYLTWSAISNEPPIPISDNLLGENFSRVKFDSSKNQTLFYCRPIGGQLDRIFGEHWSQHIIIYLGIFVMLCFAMYASFRTATEYEKFGIKKSRSNLARSLASLSQASHHFSVHGSAYSLSAVNPSTEGEPHSGAKLAAKVSGSVPNLPLVELGLGRARRPSNQQLANAPLVDKRLDRLRRSEGALFGRRRTQSEGRGDGEPRATPVSFASDSEAPDVELVADRRKRKLRAKRPARLRKESASVSVLSLSDRLIVLPAPGDDWLLRDEFFATRYNYAFFHVIFALASLFVMSHLTNWFDPVGSHLGQVGTTWQTVWFKMACCWSAYLLFGCSLICRRLCCGRDLVELHRDTFTRNKERRQSQLAQSPRSPTGVRAPILASPMEEDEEHIRTLSGRTDADSHVIV